MRSEGTLKRLAFGSGLLLTLFLCGCTPQKTVEAVSKMAKVAMDPDLPIGPPKDIPSKATFTIYAEADVNRNAFGESSPMDVWLFQLSDDGKFLTSDYETLTGNAKDTLGSSYVDHKQVQSEPNKSKIVTDWEIKKDARQVGVAIGYKDIGKADWRTVERINPTGEAYQIVVVAKVKYVLLEVHR